MHFWQFNGRARRALATNVTEWWGLLVIIVIVIAW
jgi:hypothetical protein